MAKPELTEAEMAFLEDHGIMNAYNAVAEVVRERERKAWDRGMKDAERGCCCGCNLEYDEDGNEILNPYGKPAANSGYTGPTRSRT